MEIKDYDKFQESTTKLAVDIHDLIESYLDSLFDATYVEDVAAFAATDPEKFKELQIPADSQEARARCSEEIYIKAKAIQLGISLHYCKNPDDPVGQCIAFLVLARAFHNALVETVEFNRTRHAGA